MAGSDRSLIVADQSSASRRCWRCLQTFACAEGDVAAGPPEWWLCDPCQLALIGPRSPGQS